MKKKYSLVLVAFLCFVVSGYGQGLETFTNSNADATYANRSFLGDNGVTWSYIQSKDQDNDNNSGITGNALMLGGVANGSKVTSSSIAGGIGDFSIKLYKGFTGGGNRQVELFVNNISQGTSTPFDDFNEHIFSVDNIDISGNVIIEIKNITSRLAIIDDIFWTSAASDPTITVTQASGGTISPGPASYTTGADQSFTAVPDSCHTFSNWIIDGSTTSTANPCTITNITADHSITAVYNSYNYNITASSGPNGGITPSGITRVACGSNQSYTITPEGGYAIDDVLVDGASVGALSSYDFTNVTATHTISASFVVFVGPCASESFNNSANSSSYGLETWIGDNGIQWKATDSRSDQDLNGNHAIMLRIGSLTNVSSFTGGCGVITFDYAQIYGGDSTLKLFINGTQNGADITANSTSSNTFSTTVNMGGNIDVELRNSSNRTLINNLSWTCYSSIPVPEIKIQGHSIEIVNGDKTPDVSDNTDFGNVAVAGGTKANIFTIVNTGTADLDITSVTSSNASEFAVTGTTSGIITPSNSVTFKVTFNPGAIGLRTAKITVNNDDADEDPYTFAVSGNGTNSNLSTIIDNTNYRSTAPEFNSNPEYINFIDASSTTTGKFIPMKIKILDGPDADSFGTTLTNLRLTVKDVSNTDQLAMIKTALLTTSGGTVLATASRVGDELVFSGMSGPEVTASDDDLSGKILHIRVSFDETQVIDKTKLVFKITSATANPSGSSFAALDAGGAQSNPANNSQNRLNVTADRLHFLQQPSDTSIGINISPSPVVILTDLYGRTDLDITTGTIAMTSTGTPNTQPSASISAGQAVFNNINHSIVGGPFTLTAGYSGWTVVSSPFNISNTVNGSYRTTSNGTWASTNGSGTATWQEFTGTWTNMATEPPTNTSNPVFIRHDITLVGTNSASDLTIENGSVFRTSTISATFTNILVKTGGVFKKEANSIKINGILEVENGATLTFKHTDPTSRTTNFWNGTEKFHEDSNFIIETTDSSSNFLVIETNAEVSEFNGGCFGNVIIDNSNGKLQLLPSGFNKTLCKGNLIFRNHTDNLRISNGNYSTTIKGNVIVESTFNHDITFLTTDGVCTINIEGDLLHEGPQDLRLTNSQTSNKQDVTFNIDGNIILNGGILKFDIGSSSEGTSTVINLKGDISATTTGLISNDNAQQSGFLYFDGIGDGLTNATTQTIDIASTNDTQENKYINFNVENGAYVKLINRNFELGKNSALMVKFGGTLDFGSNGATALNVAISGSQTGTTFSSRSGSTLIISSPDGITTTAGLGNVKTVPSYRSFSQTATFNYVGKEDQVTGNAILSGSTGKIVNVNLIDNSTTLTLTNNIGISEGNTLDGNGGKLEINKGIVIGSNTGDFFGSGRLVMTDGEYRISTITAAPLTDYLPQLGSLPGIPGIGGYANYSISRGTIHLNGNNDIQILSGSPTYYNLAFSGINTRAPLPYNYKGISKAVAIVNTATISENAIVDVESKAFGGTGTNLIMQDNARYITAGVGTKPDAFNGTYSFGANTTIEFNNNAGLEEIRLSNPVPRYANIVVSGSNVGTIALGTGSNSFIQFQPNGSFSVTESGIFKLKNSFGFSGTVNTAISNTNNPTITLEDKSTIAYVGADQNITYFDSEYKNLTISGTGTKILGHPTDILIGGNLKVNASTLLVKTDEAITVDESVIVDDLANFNIENSGSLIQIDDSKTNTGKIAMIRKASIKNQDYVYWSSPITGYNVDNITTTNHIYTWGPTAPNPNNTQGNWISATNEIMVPGKGYIVRAPKGQPDPSTPSDLNFTTIFYNADLGLGVPNNGVISIGINRGSNANSVDPTDDNWNLLGNPYPSAIFIEDFLNQNTSIDGYVNLWKHGLPLDSYVSPFYQNFSLSYHQADYFYYNSSGSSDGPTSFTGYIAAGQGFMVNMEDGQNPASGTVIFNNSMRDKAYANNQFFRATQKPDVFEEKHRIWLDLISPTMPTNRILVGYINGATMDKDRMFDAQISFDALTDGLYTLINEEPYLIQGRSLPFYDSDVIPLGLKVTQSENYTIAIVAVDGLFDSDNQIIYLKDNLFDFTHNLTNQPYSFTSEAGTFNERFEIVFVAKTLSSTEQIIASEAVSIIELKDGRVKFFVGHHLTLQKIEIFDLLGRRLYQLKANDSTEIYELSNLSQSAYFSKVTLSNGQVISKRAIKQY